MTHELGGHIKDTALWDCTFVLENVAFSAQHKKYIQQKTTTVRIITIINHISKKKVPIFLSQ